MRERGRGRGRRKSVRSGQLRYRTAVGCRLKARPAVPVTAVMSHDLPHKLSHFWPIFGGYLLAAMQSMDGGKPNLPLQANPERKET